MSSIVAFKQHKPGRGCKMANKVELYGWIARLKALKNIRDIPTLNPGNRRA